MIEALVPLRSSYRFGPFALDVDRRMLVAGAQARPLGEKVFQVLVMLLEAGGRVVEKREFFERIWPDDTSDANLVQHVFLLRSLLGETARDNAYVVTVPGRGYRLAMPVERTAGLTMKMSCERCNVALGPGDAAFICSYECTFCRDCTTAMHDVCPNCSGELVARPRRL